MNQVFYSWQDARDPETTRRFISSAVEQAIPNVEVVEAARDGMDVYRIRRSCCCVIDLTSVPGERVGVTNPNPDGMVEYGLAVEELGWERVLCVANKVFGVRKLMERGDLQNTIIYALESDLKMKDRLLCRDHFVEAIEKKIGRYFEALGGEGRRMESSF